MMYSWCIYGTGELRDPLPIHRESWLKGFVKPKQQQSTDIMRASIYCKYEHG